MSTQPEVFALPNPLSRDTLDSFFSAQHGKVVWLYICANGFDPALQSTLAHVTVLKSSNSSTQNDKVCSLLTQLAFHTVVTAIMKQAKCQFHIYCMDIANGREETNDYDLNCTFQQVCYSVLQQEHVLQQQLHLTHFNRNKSEKNQIYVWCPFSYFHNVSLPHGDALSKHPTTSIVVAPLNCGNGQATIPQYFGAALPPNVQVCKCNAAARYGTCTCIIEKIQFDLGLQQQVQQNTREEEQPSSLLLLPQFNYCQQLFHTVPIGQDMFD